MKTTGMFRQLDSLGRIVLPIELRRTLDINTRDMLEILTLLVFEGRLQTEIARKLGCSPQNVSERLARFRRYLRMRMGREPEGTAK